MTIGRFRLTAAIRNVVGGLFAAVVAMVAAAAAAVVRRRWLVVRVRGNSMLPTLRGGDLLVARRSPPGSVGSGDIVVCRWPDASTMQVMTVDGQPVANPATPTTLLVKRVAAVAGEPVPGPVRRAVHPATVVPPGSLVLLADNDGLDSRVFGFLPDDRVIAVVSRKTRNQRQQRAETR